MHYIQNKALQTGELPAGSTIIR